MEDQIEGNEGATEIVSQNKKEWLGKEIKPISSDEIERVMRSLYSTVLSLDEYAYTTTRGVEQLLGERSYDYAKLPPFGGESSMQIFKSLGPQQEWLDLGCGSGTFIVDVLKTVNPKIKATGFDARKWESQESVPELILGDIDRIDRSMFPKHPKGFDLITSASVFYHLPDYWGALGKAVNLLKTNGKIIISTINRPLSGGTPINGPGGEFIHNPEDYGASYYRNRNIFDINGNLMSMAEAVRLINSQNPGFKLEYHSGANKEATTGELSYGGGFSGKKLGAKPMNLSCVFYCYYPERSNNAVPGLTDISFIFARSKEEFDKLKSDGYVSVQDRMK